MIEKIMRICREYCRRKCGGNRECYRLCMEKCVKEMLE